MELADHLGDKGGPASLMAGPHAGAIVAVEVLIENDLVAPVGIA